MHINKGRLHCFRKKAPAVGTKEELCVSVAWDWIFAGVTAKGVQAETAAAMQAARLNAKKGVQSLGVIDACTLHGMHAALARLDAAKAVAAEDAAVGAAGGAAAAAAAAAEAPAAVANTAMPAVRGLGPCLDRGWASPLGPGQDLAWARDFQR